MQNPYNCNSEHKVILKHQMSQCPQLCKGNCAHSQIVIEGLLRARHFSTKWAAAVNIREKSCLCGNPTLMEIGCRGVDRQ